MGKKGQRHGMVGTPTYSSWFHMIQRCTNPNDKDWEHYGGRGITVCARWRAFVNFWDDMGTCPEGLTLERKKNDGNYTRKNCHWATRKQQADNRRTNLLITVGDVTKTSLDWAKSSGLKRQTIEQRIHLGWEPARAVTVEPMLRTAKRKVYHR